MPRLPQYPANRSEQTGLRIYPDSIQLKPSKHNQPNPRRKTRTYVVTIRLEDLYRHEVEIELTPGEFEERDARLISRKIVNAIAGTSTICTVDPGGQVSHNQTLFDNWRHNCTPELFDL